MTNDRVLVAIVNHLADFALVRDQHWYRIPVGSADKWLAKHWPPAWMAFYHTKVFGSLAYGIHHYAQVTGMRQVARWEIFPDEPRDSRSERRY